MATYLKARESTSENDTSSHSSRDSSKPTLLTQYRNDISKQRNKNMQKYDKIVKQNPRFYLYHYENK